MITKEINTRINEKTSAIRLNAFIINYLRLGIDVHLCHDKVMYHLEWPYS